MNLRIADIRYAIMNCAAWALIAVYAMYLKYIGIHRLYFILIQQASYGEVSLSPFRNLVDMFQFYSADIILLLFGFLVIFLVSFFIKRKILTSILSVGSIILIMLLYGNQHSWGTVGQYLNFSSAKIAISFAIEAPETALSYVQMSSILKFITILFFALFLVIWGRLILKLKIINQIITPFFIISIVFLTIIVMIGSFSNIGRPPILAGYLSSSIHAIIPNSSKDLQVPKKNKAVLNFGAVPSAQKNPLAGAAEDNDIIVFILETVPERFMPLKKQLADYPTLSSLSDHSMIALQHYTTFPASVESFTSILYGNYPPKSYYSTCLLGEEIKKGYRIPGLVADLEAVDVKTGLYMPYRVGGMHQANSLLDATVHKNSGFAKVYYANNFKKIKGKIRDEQALLEMMGDIKKWIKKDQRYAMFFVPQIGHPPWDKRGKDTSIVEYGHALTVLQDQWIGAVVKLLKEQGRLGKTTIIVTGDHGVRSEKEDPIFISGKIDEYSFHVPLFIYSSHISGKNYINTPTSHIDIAPTISSLHNLKSTRSDYVGIPLWQVQDISRDVFFPAGWYYSADSFVSKGIYYMWSPPLDLIYQNTNLIFFAKDIVKDEKVKEAVKNKINSFYAYQNARLEKICDQISQR